MSDQMMIDILPLNTIEIMTMVNFGHLDEEKLLDNGQVLKQKSGYTHSFNDELLEIFKEFNITPHDEIKDIYGDYYINIFEYNKYLYSEIHKEEISGELEKCFRLFSPYFYKYFYHIPGYEEELLNLRRIFKLTDKNKIKDELSQSVKKIKEKLSFMGEVEGDGIRGYFEQKGLLSKQIKKLRFEIYDEISVSAEILQTNISYFKKIDSKISDFARNNKKILATLIQRFQDLGVDLRKEETPNNDFYKFYKRYNGDLEVKFT